MIKITIKKNIVIDILQTSHFKSMICKNCVLVEKRKHIYIYERMFHSHNQIRSKTPSTSFVTRKRNKKKNSNKIICCCRLSSSSFPLRLVGLC